MYSVFNYIQIHIYRRDFKRECPPPLPTSTQIIFFLICNEHLQKLQWACFSEIRRWGISCVCLRSALWKKIAFYSAYDWPLPENPHNFVRVCVFITQRLRNSSKSSAHWNDAPCNSVPYSFCPFTTSHTFDLNPKHERDKAKNGKYSLKSKTESTWISQFVSR